MLPMRFVEGATSPQRHPESTYTEYLKLEKPMTRLKLTTILTLSLFMVTSLAWADSLELKNGSLIKGKFISGTASQIVFQVGSSRQTFNIADIVSLKFDSDTPAAEILSVPPTAQTSTEVPASKDGLMTRSVPRPENTGSRHSSTITIPAGTRISVRTIDGIDSTQNQVGDRFQASLEEPLFVDGREVVAKGTELFGRLTDSKTTGTFTGKSELAVELTGIVVNGQTIPMSTGEYQVSGKSRSASTAKRTVGGAAVGSIIGAIAGGGKGAAIGAGVGGGVGAGSQTITKGDQVRIPSETLLDFTLQQDLVIPTQR